MYASHPGRVHRRHRADGHSHGNHRGYRDGHVHANPDACPSDLDGDDADGDADAHAGRDTSNVNPDRDADPDATPGDGDADSTELYRSMRRFPHGNADRDRQPHAELDPAAGFLALSDAALRNADARARAARVV